jgi:hypothetical protein
MVSQVRHCALHPTLGLTLKQPEYSTNLPQVADAVVASSA